MGSRPKKKWGQNFLRNRGAAEKIVAALEPQSGELIVEIGPGEGVLTERLVGLGHPLQLIEIDPELASRLQVRFAAAEIRNEDAVEAPLPQRPFCAIGNLPYNAGTPILRRVIAHPQCQRAVFMLQKEVAQRLVAQPGDEQYGFLTLYREMFASARIIMNLGPKSFHPRPKVDSAVVLLDPRPPAYASDPAALLDLISHAFRMRRKKLINNLIEWKGEGRAAWEQAMQAAQIDLDVRGEQLSLMDFDRLLRASGELQPLSRPAP